MNRETIQLPERCALSIKVLATNFMRSSTPKQPSRKSDHMWKKPSNGTVETNVDASFYAQTPSGATRVVAWDDWGQLCSGGNMVPNPRE